MFSWMAVVNKSYEETSTRIVVSGLSGTNEAAGKAVGDNKLPIERLS